MPPRFLEACNVLRIFGGLIPSIRQSATAKLAVVAVAERSAIAAVLSEHTAVQKCQFSGFLPHIRRAIRREICNYCKKYSIYRITAQTLIHN